MRHAAAPPHSRVPARAATFSDHSLGRSASRTETSQSGRIRIGARRSPRRPTLRFLHCHPFACSRRLGRFPPPGSLRDSFRRGCRWLDDHRRHARRFRLAQSPRGTKPDSQRTMALALGARRARTPLRLENERTGPLSRHRNAACPGLRRKHPRLVTTLVTGAAGFLGSHVTRQLVARGDDVRVLMRPSSTNRAIADLSLEYVTGDLRDPASLDRAMKDVKRVFHVAADYRLWARRKQDIYDSNVGGTKNLLDAAKRAGVEQLIYTSTVASILMSSRTPGSKRWLATTSVRNGSRKRKPSAPRKTDSP